MAEACLVRRPDERQKPGARRRIGWAVAAGATVLLALLAARADQRALHATLFHTALDVGVGLAFVIVGAATPTDTRNRVGMAAIGAAWLLGSVVPSSVLVHQALLIVVLVAFPTGRRHRRAGWLFVMAAVPVALLLVPQFGVAVLFTAVAIYQMGHLRADAAAVWYPIASAGSLALVLGGAWFAARTDPATFDPSVALLVYELVLLGVAVGFPVATWTAAAARRQLADVVIADTRRVGLAGLSVILGEALDDPSLAVYRWNSAQAEYVDDDGRPLVRPPTASWLSVEEGDTPLGAVVHSSNALADPTTAAAVSTAVRLHLANIRHQQDLAAQLDELEASRARFVTAADRQRADTAAKLRHSVVGELESTLAAVGAQDISFGSAEAGDAAAVAVSELAGAADEIVALVAGVPNAPLGGGRLRHAVEGMKRAYPLPVTVIAQDDFAGDTDIETTLYYVCSEALTNAVKYAAATEVHITLSGVGSELAIEVRDDGRGGADPEGTGLLGLADRVAARGGRLRVVSPPEAGTVVAAVLPRSSSGDLVPGFEYALVRHEA